MVKSSVLCFLVLITPMLGAQTPTPPTSSPTSEAQKLLDTGRLDEALKALDTLAQQQPEPAGVERLRGMAFYEQGQLQASEAAFEHSLAQEPSDREAMQMEAVALFASATRQQRSRCSSRLTFPSPAPTSTAT